MLLGDNDLENATDSITIRATLVVEKDSSCQKSYHILTVPPICSKQYLVCSVERQCGLGVDSIAPEELFVVHSKNCCKSPTALSDRDRFSLSAKKVVDGVYSLSSFDEIFVFVKACNIIKPTKRKISPNSEPQRLLSLCKDLIPAKFSNMHAYPQSNSKTNICSKADSEQIQLEAENEEFLPTQELFSIKSKSHEESESVPSRSELKASVESFHWSSNDFSSHCTNYCYDSYLEMELESEMATETGAETAMVHSESQPADDMEEFRDLVDYISQQLGENLYAQKWQRRFAVADANRSVETDYNYDFLAEEEEEEMKYDCPIIYADDSTVDPNDACDASIVLDSINMKLSVSFSGYADGLNSTACDVIVLDLSANESKLFEPVTNLTEGRLEQALKSNLVQCVQQKCDEILHDYFYRSEEMKEMSNVNISGANEAVNHISIVENSLFIDDKKAIAEVYMDLEDIM